MRFRPTCALLSVSLVASGCSVYRIRGADRNGLAGVPFFPHVGVCRHETSYIQPVYRVAVQLVAGSREIVLFDASLTAVAVASSELAELRREIAKEDADLPRIGEAFERLTRNTRHQYDPQAPPTGLVLAGNVTAAETQVDYGNPLYMNVSRPWIGSASASARLAPDGTLAEATAEVKDSAVDAVLRSLPAKELLTTFASGDRIRALLGATTGGSAALQLIVQPTYVKHSYTVVGPAPCPRDLTPIAPGTPGAMYRREEPTVAPRDH